MLGVCIDDMVMLELVDKSLFVEGLEPEFSKHRLRQVRQAYQDVGLPTNDDKSFAGVTKAEFWGAAVDGASGDVRALPSRALPLMSLMVSVAKLKFCTRALLESIAGSLVALFTFRRRLLSLLNLIYSEPRRYERTQVFPMSSSLQQPRRPYPT